jgi:hypothetical protein
VLLEEKFPSSKTIGSLSGDEFLSPRRFDDAEPETALDLLGVDEDSVSSASLLRNLFFVCIFVFRKIFKKFFHNNYCKVELLIA